MQRLFLLICSVAFAALAQPAAVPQVTSPDVHADRSVTFRIYAPEASEVAFFGDWMAPGTSQNMNKGEDGVWAITVPPLRPSIYIYNFILDGLPIADPVNPRMKLRARTSASLVEVRSDS